MKGGDDVDMSGIKDAFSENVLDRQTQNAGDYVGEDGLLYCGKCRTLKQCRVRINFEWMTLPIVCACEEAQLELKEQKRKEEERRLEVEKLYESSGITKRGRRTTFDTSDETPPDECKRYAEHFRGMPYGCEGLLLWGDPGTGKTHAALCIANALLRDCTSVLMVSVPEILRTQDIDWLYDRIQRVKLLILDDLGAERGTEYAAERVYDAVDTRYRAGLPMVCTSNLSLKEMQAAPDIRQRRIYERILETCYPVHFTGARRQGMARQRFAEMRRILEDTQDKP